MKGNQNRGLIRISRLTRSSIWQARLRMRQEQNSNNNTRDRRRYNRAGADMPLLCYVLMLLSMVAYLHHFLFHCRCTITVPCSIPADRVAFTYSLLIGILVVSRTFDLAHIRIFVPGWYTTVEATTWLSSFADLCGWFPQTLFTRCPELDIDATRADVGFGTVHATGLWCRAGWVVWEW